MIQSISPDEARRLADEENALLLDVREPEEFAGAHIAGARLEPLSVLSCLPPDPDRERPAIFYCHSGRRTRDNAATLEDRGFSATYHLEGGLAGWEKAGLPVIRGRSRMPMPRQIQITAGALVFTASLISFSLPAFTWLTLCIGAGLIFAGWSGICLMAGLLARMPWNKA